MRFTIDRARWRAGSTCLNNQIGLGQTKLANPEGFRCCLGQISKQLGHTYKSMLNKCYPNSLEKENILSELVTQNGLTWHKQTKLARDAMAINDNGAYTTKEREYSLKRLFKRHGHFIKFINKPVIPDAESEA